MLPMLPSTMQVGGVSAADVSLEQMLAAVPDLDELVARLRDPPGRRPASGGPERRGPAAASGPSASSPWPTAIRAAARRSTRAWIWS